LVEIFLDPINTRERPVELNGELKILIWKSYIITDHPIPDKVIPEELYLLRYNAVQSIESQPTFRRNISPPSSGSKNKPSKKSS
jgi:hypothetical protein